MIIALPMESDVMRPVLGGVWSKHGDVGEASV